MHGLEKNPGYCFDPRVFEQEKFTVDTFVTKCIEENSLQAVHDDLQRYLHQLEQQVG